MNKKEYMKPDMRVVEIKHRCRLLNASLEPNGYNNQNVKMFGGSKENQVMDEEDII